MGRKGSLKGHEQEILTRIAQRGELAVDLAREFGVSKSAISQMKRLHDVNRLSYHVWIGLGVRCSITFEHTRPVTQAHIQELIRQLQQQAELLGEEGRYEEEDHRVLPDTF